MQAGGEVVRIVVMGPQSGGQREPCAAGQVDEQVAELHGRAAASLAGQRRLVARLAALIPKADLMSAGRSQQLGWRGCRRGSRARWLSPLRWP